MHRPQNFRFQIVFNKLLCLLYIMHNLFTHTKKGLETDAPSSTKPKPFNKTDSFP